MHLGNLKLDTCLGLFFFYASLAFLNSSNYFLILHLSLAPLLGFHYHNRYQEAHLAIHQCLEYTT